MSPKKPQKPATKATEPAPDPSRTLEVPARLSGMSRARMLAELAGGGVMGNACVVTEFAKGNFGPLSLTDVDGVMTGRIKAVHAGDLRGPEALLMAQALALDAMFCDLARRSALNLGQYLDASERYLRLALKAQGQCRATLETLAAIKNPPVVFARQANINNGGQQQVNNGPAPAAGPGPATPPAQQTTKPPGELLEADHEQRLDTRATRAAGRADSPLEAVGARHRAP